jgi:hypothetical protein
MVNLVQILYEFNSKFKFYYKRVNSIIVVISRIELFVSYYNVILLILNYKIFFSTPFPYKKIKNSADLPYKNFGQIFLVLTRIAHMANIQYY